MKVVLQMDFKTSSNEAAQQNLMDLCERMKQEDIISSFHFEIETKDGPVTEVCVLAHEKVIA